MKKGTEKQDSAEEEEERFPARAFDEPQRHQQSITPAPGDSSADPSSMSIIEIRSIKNWIRACIQLGMNKKEVATKLSVENGIHPRITLSAWNQLKAEKREPFKDYVENIIPIPMSNLSIDQHHHLPPAILPPLADRVCSLIRSEILNPASVAYDDQNLSVFYVGDNAISFSPNPPTEQHGPCFVHNLHQGCNNPRQLPNPYTGHLQIVSTSPISYKRFGNEKDSASSSSHPEQMIDHWIGMAMDRNTADPTQISRFGPNSRHPFSSYLPLPMEEQGQNFIEQKGQTFIEQQGQNFTEQGPGSENQPSAMLIYSDTESTTNVDQYRNLPSSDSQSEEET